MLYLKADEPRTLTFEVDVKGVGKNDLKGFVRLFIDDTEHGFPVSVNENIITTDIPPLTDILRLERVEDGDVLKAKLELMTDRNIFVPWEGEIKLRLPMGIKAKLSNESITNKSQFVAKIIENEEDKVDEEEPIEEKCKKESVEESFVDLKTNESTKDEEKIYKKDLVELIATTIKQMGLFPSQSSPEPLMEKKENKSSKEKVSESKTDKLSEKEKAMEQLKHITREGVYKYMSNAGTKNKKIQELVYEQAESAAGSSEPFKVLKYVVQIMNKRKDVK